LAAAIRELPSVLVFDNSDLSTPFRLVATYMNGCREQRNEPFPAWFKTIAAKDVKSPKPKYSKDEKKPSDGESK
jgi:hypothetical protein